MMMNRGPQKNMENMATMLLITISRILVLNWRYACEILAILLISFTFYMFHLKCDVMFETFYAQPLHQLQVIVGLRGHDLNLLNFLKSHFKDFNLVSTVIYRAILSLPSFHPCPWGNHIKTNVFNLRIKNI